MMVAIFYVVLACLLAIPAGDANDALGRNDTKPKPTPDYPIGDPRRCHVGKGEPKYRFEVLPGGGWDNLRNKDMGRIVRYNYSQCKTTDDGRFLLPDGIYSIPLKSSRVETYAELFEHWENYTSTLSRSVNVHAGLHLSHVGISGKFSDEYESVKSRQHYDKSVTTRVQARYLQYTSKLEPDTPVNEAFQKRLFKIAADLALNRSDLARYDSQLLVRDFGTHVITSIDVGAALAQVDQVNIDYMKKMASEKTTILASASASFFGVFDFGADYSQTATKTQVDTYRKQRTSSRIMTYGGPIFRPQNYTANQWSESIENDLVAMDRSGDPIYYLITENSLPGVSQSTVYDVYDFVKQAVEVYYEHNTHRGCTKQDAPNFSFQSNVDDGSCKPTKTNFTFGGVYQSCSNSGVDNLCSGMTQKNPQTGAFSCPKGYEAIPLQSGSKSASRTERKCHSCWLIATCCHNEAYHSQATYTAYWCAATGQVEANSGFLFGGLYTPTVANVMTQSRSCPVNFVPLSLLKGLVICVSDDYELGYQYSLPFAGFFSCSSGNPLALNERANLLQSRNSMLVSYMRESGLESYPHTCPEGYSQHLAIVDNGCSIHFCAKSGALSDQGLPTVQTPPFMNAPRDGFTLMTDSDIIMTSDGTVWTSLSNADDIMPSYLKRLGLWNDMSDHSVQTYTNKASQQEGIGNKSGSNLSGGSIAGITIGATLVCLVVASVVIMKIRRRRVRYREADPWSGDGESRRIVPASPMRYDQDAPSVVTRT